jgi:pimeloyl-ACP methyl ester carboxylesterase
MTARQHFVQCASPLGLHRIAYREWGDPENPKVLLCVHGLTRVGRDFDRLAQALANNYRVVSPDVVGRGDSDWLDNPMLYGLPQYVSDMVTLVARLNPGTLDWFGTSMGGLIGICYAGQKGASVRRMLINDVGPTLEAGALQRIGSYLGIERRFADLDEATQYVSLVSASFGVHTPDEWRELTEGVVRQNPDGSWRMHYDMRLAEPFKSTTPAQAMAGEGLLWHLWSAIGAQILITRGEFSDLLTPATVQAMQAANPRAQAVTIPGVGHAPTFMHADQIQIAADFFKGD